MLYQDVIGQLPILNIYSYATLGFEVADENRRETIVKALRGATDKLVANFPWLGGAVINEGKGSGNSGLFKQVPWPTCASPLSVMRVRDCADIVPSYSDIIGAGAPSFMLDGDILTPYPGFTVSGGDSVDQPRPVIAIQANFVKGGLLLTFAAQHNTIDGTGLLQVIKLIATAMRQEEFSPLAVEQGNRDRTRVVPLIAPGEPVKDYSHLRRPLNGHSPAPPSPSTTVSKWAYFRVPMSALPKIKALASQPEGYDASVPFISSQDALSALYWKCLAGVRMRNGRSPDAISKHNRAVDGRRAMGIPAEYLGHMIHHAASLMTLKELVEAPLSTVACRLRRDLNEVNNEFSVRSYTTYIANEPDKSRIMYGGSFNADTDIGSSSTSHVEFSVNFGPLLGTPQFMRRPRMRPNPGCIYFRPPENGYIIVFVCLRDDDLEGLKTHSEWSQYAEFIG